MRKITIIKDKLELKEDVEVIYEKIVTTFGNSAKVDAQKKHIGKRAYVIIMKDYILDFCPTAVVSALYK